MFDIVETTLSAAVATDGTFNVSYPSGANSGTYKNAKGHKMWAAGLQTLFDYGSSGFTLSFGASNITVTYKGSTTIPVDTRVSLQLEKIGPDSREIEVRLGDTKRTSVMTPVRINLGAPDTADPNGLIESTTPTTSGSITMDGVLVSNSVGEFDVPRNVVAVWAGADNARTLTVTGTDEYGNTVVEAISGADTTTSSGKKAFSTVTDVSIDSTPVGALTVGSGDVLGLPVFLPEAGMVVQETEDGADATAGTVVAGVQTDPATATTGDVRGTYDPNSAADGSKAFALLAYVDNPNDRGVDQYSG